MTIRIDRRDFLGMTAGAGATLALAPQLLRAQELSRVEPIQRAIPSSGERLPVIGLQFQNDVSQDLAALKPVLQTLLDNGGKFFDTVHQSLPGVEDRMATLATELGIQDKLFLGLRGAPSDPQQTGPGAAKRQVEALLAKFKAAKLDLVQLASNAEPSMFAALKEEKSAGRVRYIGATTINPKRYPELEALMRSEPIDFIGVDYSVERRGVEELILPLAQERKIGVVAYFPFGINSGALFRRVGASPLPEWAAEFEAKSWAQFFIKYVISHPAITVVRTGTSQVKHMLDNLGGGVGRLPDESMRKRMTALVDALPPATPR